MESEAREVVDRAVHAEVERDTARHDLVMARLEIEAAGSFRAQVESELARVQCALTAVEDTRRKVEFELDVAQQALAASREACRKAEEETSRLIDKRVSLVVKLEARKDELSVFQAEASKEKKVMEAEFDTAFEVIFKYGYGCCALTHNICGSKPRIPARLPGTSQPLSLEFFINPRCLPDDVLVGASVAPKAGINEEVEHSSTTEAKVGDNPDSLSRVAGERKKPNASGES